MRSRKSHAFPSLQAGQTSTKRAIFYQDVNLYGTQAVSDSAIESLAQCLRVPRRCLNIVASSGKGIVAGDMKLKFKNCDEAYDCSNSSYHCNESHGDLQTVETESDYLLIVESESTFNVLLSQNAVALNNCIMVTGKGDSESRRLS